MLTKAFCALGAITGWSLIFTGHVAAQLNVPPVQVASPGEAGRRITEDGLLANCYPAKQKAAALLTLDGSVGGISPPMNDTSKALQAEGFSVLHLSYFRAPGQNPRAELLPLEYFATALAWLKRQPEVDPTQVGIVWTERPGRSAAPGPKMENRSLTCPTFHMMRARAAQWPTTLPLR